jgi:hypothetical protein
MSARFPKGDKIATLIFRGIIFCLGVLLLVVFIKIWSTGDFRRFGICCALISLFIGYGIGGDIWGARLFSFFRGRNVERDAAQPSPRLSKTLLFILVGFLVFLIALFIRLLIYNLYHAAA